MPAQETEWTAEMARALPGDERPGILDGVLRWQARDDVAPLEIGLPAFFAKALD